MLPPDGTALKKDDIGQQKLGWTITGTITYFVQGPTD